MSLSDLKQLFFVPDGKINRSTFFMATVAIMAVSMVIYFLIFDLIDDLGFSQQVLDLSDKGFMYFSGFLYVAISIYPTYCIAAKRYRDIFNKPNKIEFYLLFYVISIFANGAGLVVLLLTIYLCLRAPKVFEENEKVEYPKVFIPLLLISIFNIFFVSLFYDNSTILNTKEDIARATVLAKDIAEKSNKDKETYLIDNVKDANFEHHKNNHISKLYVEVPESVDLNNVSSSEMKEIKEGILSGMCKGSFMTIFNEFPQFNMIIENYNYKSHKKISEVTANLETCNAFMESKK